MHQFERIALWSIIILIVLFLFFRGRASGYENSSNNLMSLAEFSGVPDTLKGIYSEAITPVTNKLGQSLTMKYNKLTKPEKENLINILRDNAAKIASVIDRTVDDVINRDPTVQKSPSMDPMIISSNSPMVMKGGPAMPPMMKGGPAMPPMMKGGNVFPYGF